MTEELYDYPDLPSHEVAQWFSNDKVSNTIFWAQVETEKFCERELPSLTIIGTEELMLLNCGVGEDSWESLGLQGDATSPS